MTRKTTKRVLMIAAAFLLLLFIILTANNVRMQRELDTSSPATTSAPRTSQASPPRTPEPPAPAAPAPVADPGPGRDITGREWQLLARDPGAHVGERVIVHGRVFQFDSTTGNEAFLANVAGDRDEDGHYFDGVVTLVRGSAEQFANLVEDDNFEADVTVLGSYDYETRIGGSNTAVVVTVNNIKVTP